MTAPVSWMQTFAAQQGLRYEPQADERWLRAWEPYATLKVATRYEHALHATGAGGSLSVARAVVTVPRPSAHGEAHDTDVGAWVAIVQDPRLTGHVATTSDLGGVFGDPLDLVTLPRQRTGEPAFDHVFATFGKSAADVAHGLTPSVRKLLLGWRIPVHAELRPGGFVLAPVALPPDPGSLAWLLSAIHAFGEKANKRAT